MQNIEDISGVPWQINLQRWNDSVRGEVAVRPRFGYPKRLERSTILPRIRELLQTICQGFCNNRGPLYAIDREGYGVAMGTLPMACLSTIEGILMRYASLAVPKP